MSGKQNTVLFVENEGFTLKNIEKELADEPYSLLLAHSSREALDMLIRNEIAIVVVELMMPILSGKELLNIVKNDYPDTIRIITSGTADRNTLQNLHEEELANAYFLKPYRWEAEVKPKILQFLCFYRMNTTSRSLRNALRSVMELSHDGFILIDSLGCIQYSNPAVRAMFGRDLQDLELQLKPMLEAGRPKSLELSGKSGQKVVLEELINYVDWEDTDTRLAVLIKRS